MIKIPGLNATELNIVQECFDANISVKLFGSRVVGNFRPNSDLDICILSDLNRAEVSKLAEKFEESNLPFTVDIVLYKDCSGDFKKIIDNTGVSLYS